MTLENILEKSKRSWGRKLFEREIGVEEFETLATTKVQEYRPIKEMYAELFAQERLSIEPAQQYLTNRGFTDFRHISTNTFSISYAFGSVTGLWKGSQASSKVRKKLVERNLLSGDLTDNPDREEIFELLLLPRNSVKDYFSEDIVGKENVKINQALYTQSKAFRTYCSKHRIDPTRRVTSQKLQRHLKRFTGRAEYISYPKG